MRIDLHIHSDDHNELLDLVKEIDERTKLMATSLDQVLADVTAESTLDDSIIALLQGIAQQLKDALSGVTLPPAAQAKVDAIFAATEANVAKVTAAIAANTPPPA